MKVEIKGCCLKQDNETFTSKNALNLLVFYKLDTLPQDLHADFTLKDCMFRAIQLPKNPDPDKHSYSGSSIRFHSRSIFSITNFNQGKNVVIFGVDNSSSANSDNKEKEILVTGDAATLELDNTSITTETKY